MSRPLRVMQVALRLDPGGAERLIVDIAKGLPTPDFESVVCCLDEPGAWAKELEDAGIPVFSLGRQPGFRPGLSRRLAALAHEQGATVLHCHQYSPYVYGCVAKLFRPSLRLVFTEHGRLSDAPPSFKRKLVNPLLASLPGARFAVCRELRDFMLQEGFPARRLGVVYNGIALGDAPADSDRAAARARLGLPADRFVIGTVARLDPVKDHGTLIDAVAALDGVTPLPHLAVIGDGPEREALETRVRERGAEDRVTFLGNRNDVRELLPGLDLYVNSSRYEGVSLTIVEAMAARLPVIATDVGGTPEVVDSGRSGLLVPAGNPGALAEAVRGLAAEPDRRERYAAEGRRVAEERFAFRKMLAQYLEAYRGRPAGS